MQYTIILFWQIFIMCEVAECLESIVEDGKPIYRMRLPISGQNGRRYVCGISNGYGYISDELALKTCRHLKSTFFKYNLPDGDTDTRNPCAWPAVVREEKCHHAKRER